MYNYNDGVQVASGKIYRYSTPLFDKKQVLFYRLSELSITLVKDSRLCVQVEGRPSKTKRRRALSHGENDRADNDDEKEKRRALMDQLQDWCPSI